MNDFKLERVSNHPEFAFILVGDTKICVSTGLAEYIVRACNLHDQLVGVCEDLLDEFPNGNDSPLGNLTLGGALMRMRDVVSKAKVKT